MNSNVSVHDKSLQAAALHRLPSLDTFNDYFPGRFPGFWELKTREDLLEMAAFVTGVPVFADLCLVGNGKCVDARDDHATLG